MALRTILHYPDPRLRRRAQPVTDVNDEIRQLIDDMAETMYAAPGIGLAAIQVDEPKRILVIDISDSRDQLQVFINPEILDHDGEQPPVRDNASGRRRVRREVQARHRLPVLGQGEG